MAAAREISSTADSRRKLCDSHNIIIRLVLFESGKLPEVKNVPGSKTTPGRARAPPAVSPGEFPKSSPSSQTWKFTNQCSENAFPCGDRVTSPSLCAWVRSPCWGTCNYWWHGVPGNHNCWRRIYWLSNFDSLTIILSCVYTPIRISELETLS